MKSASPTHRPPKLALGAPLVYFDSDPAKLSFILFGAVTARYIESGSYYFRGGSRALTMALIRLIKDASGEALHSRTVERVLLDKQGHAAGVRHRGAQGEVRDDVAAVVFGNAAPSMLAEMLPDAQRVTFERAFARFEPSNSLFTVSLDLHDRRLTSKSEPTPHLSTPTPSPGSIRRRRQRPSLLESR